MAITVTTAPEPRTKAGLMRSLVNPAWTAGRESSVEGLYAEVEVDGLHLQVSRLAGEDGWTVDAAFRGSFPLFANGYGARYLVTRRVAADVAAVLDAAVVPAPAPARSINDLSSLEAGRVAAHIKGLHGTGVVTVGSSCLMCSGEIAEFVESVR